MRMFTLILVSVFFTMPLLSTAKEPTPINNQSIQTAPSLPAAGQIMAYYNAQGQHRQHAYEAIYYRHYLGLNAQGKHQLQDFYVKTKLPQTNVYTLYDAQGLWRWDNQEFIDGKLELFDADGAINTRMQLNQGAYSGTKSKYYPEGGVFRYNVYDSFGNPLHTRYYRPDGTALYQITFDLRSDDEQAYVLFNQQGIAYTQSQLSPHLIKQAEQELTTLINRMEAHRAQVAGKNPPEAMHVVLYPKLLPNSFKPINDTNLYKLE